MTTTMRGPLALQLNLFVPPLSSSGGPLEATLGRSSRPSSSTRSSAGAGVDGGSGVDESEARCRGDQIT